MKIPIDLIDADEDFNCRDGLTLLNVKGLAEDIAEHGLLQPIVVNKKENSERYACVAGFRRFKACKHLGWGEIEANVQHDLSPAKMLILNISENLVREDLTILEEAKAVQRLTAEGLTEAEIVNILHTSRGWVQVRKRLLALPEDIQKEAGKDRINQTHINALYTLRYNKDKLYELLRSIKSAGFRLDTKESLPEHRENPWKQRMPNKTDMTYLMEEIAESIGYGFHTRVLAYCMGGLSEMDILNHLAEEAAKLGVVYTPDEMGLNPRRNVESLYSDIH